MSGPFLSGGLIAEDGADASRRPDALACGIDRPRPAGALGERNPLDPRVRGARPCSPASPSARAPIAATPKRAASTRSKGVGGPPRWTWPSTTPAHLVRQERLQRMSDHGADPAEADGLRAILHDLAHHRAATGARRAFRHHDDGEPAAAHHPIAGSPRQPPRSGTGPPGSGSRPLRPPFLPSRAIQPVLRPMTSSTMSR